MPRITATPSEEEYIVEQVLDIRGHGGSTEYLLKYEGFEEPEWTYAKFTNCRQAVRQYHNRRRAQRRYEARRAAGRRTRGPNKSKVEPKLKTFGTDIPVAEAADGEPTCVCCQTNKITHIVQPCNHACLCSLCAAPCATLHGCPKCRHPIEKIAPFYLS